MTIFDNESVDELLTSTVVARDTDSVKVLGWVVTSLLAKIVLLERKVDSKCDGCTNHNL